MWCDTKRRILRLVELTVCFESNFKEAALRKTAKYIDLVNQAKINSYNAALLTLQVGSIGVPDYNSFAKLANLLSMSARDLNHLLHHVTRAAIAGSFNIWCSRNRPV